MKHEQGAILNYKFHQKQSYILNYPNQSIGYERWDYFGYWKLELIADSLSCIYGYYVD